MPSCTPATLAYRPLRHGAGPALHSRARILFRRATVPGWSERTYGVSQSFTIGRRTTQRVRVGDPLVFRQPQTRGSAWPANGTWSAAAKSWAALLSDGGFLVHV